MSSCSAARRRRSTATSGAARAAAARVGAPRLAAAAALLERVAELHLERLDRGRIRAQRALVERDALSVELGGVVERQHARRLLRGGEHEDPRALPVARPQVVPGEHLRVGAGGLEDLGEPLRCAASVAGSSAATVPSRIRSW